MSGNKTFGRFSAALFASVLAVIWGGYAHAKPLGIALPSGVEPTLHEWLLDTQPNGDIYARFRFIAPDISRDTGRFTLPDLADDFQVLCDEFAVVNIAAQPTPVDLVIISFSDRKVDFGYGDPDATQYFESFRLENGTCIWEYF